jgi:serine/threonine protein kinase
LVCHSCGTDAGEVSKFCPSCGSTLVRNASERDSYVGKSVYKGKYRIEKMIGEGGMGKVYRAVQIALEKPVVLKVLRQTLLSDERTVQRFQREARAASRLNHPNSISVLDFGELEDGALFIAMEFVAGRDLHQLLTKEWPLTEARLVRIISQVLSALADAHAAQIVHRDLKPENIMVEQRRGGEADFVKVLDFGIAKILDSTGDEGPALTRAGFVCGTPEYMSPEQARGAQLDHRSDLYAVGVILYQMVTNLLPFDSDSAVGFATKHLTEIPVAPSKKRPDARISPALEKLILRAMAKDPNERPATAEAFKAELLAIEKRGAPMQLTQTVSDEEQSETRIVNPASLVKRPVSTPPRRSPPAQAAAAAAPASSLSEEEPLPELEGRGSTLAKAAMVAVAVAALGIGGYYVQKNFAGETPSDPGVPTDAMVTSRGGKPVPLYDAEIEPDRRNTEKAVRLSREGDQAHRRGDQASATKKYLEAFEHDPDPELALKLGELYHQRNDSALARAWWGRHLKDRTGSKARSYIQQQFPDL